MGHIEKGFGNIDDYYKLSLIHYSQAWQGPGTDECVFSYHQPAKPQCFGYYFAPLAKAA